MSATACFGLRAPSSTCIQSPVRQADLLLAVNARRCPFSCISDERCRTALALNT